MRSRSENVKVVQILARLTMNDWGSCSLKALRSVSACFWSAWSVTPTCCWMIAMSYSAMVSLGRFCWFDPFCFFIFQVNNYSCVFLIYYFSLCSVKHGFREFFISTKHCNPILSTLVCAPLFLTFSFSLFHFSIHPPSIIHPQLFP